MQITKIEIFKADLPLKRTFRIAIGEIKVAKSIFIRIHTDSGVYGIGEGNLLVQVTSETQATALAAAQELATLLVGKDPLDIENRARDMRAYMPHNPTTRSAFDMALYDLLGKAANLPLYAVLGGARCVLITDNTVGIDPTEEMVEHALEIKARGFPAVKVKVGTTPEQDIERIRLIREAIGPELSIRIDANQGWDRMGAIQALMKSKRYERAVEQANKMMAHVNAPLPDLFYQRAMAEQAMGENERAAMSYLRVAIHFPHHKLAIPALYQAGKSLTRVGDTLDAAKVYQEALKRAKNPQTRRSIQQALDALPRHPRPSRQPRKSN